jgi:small subunit ribosomal protein S17
MAEEEEKLRAEEEPPSEAPDSNASEAAPSSADHASAPEQAALDPTVPAVPAEPLTPKERRRQARATKTAAIPARPPRTAEERQAEREAERRQKAQVRRAQRLRGREKARAGKGEAVPTPAREHTPGRQKTRQGVVVSDRADKTITVRIDVTRRHPRYEKIVRTSSTLHAHDERNDAHVGDTVLVRESRPLSRTKHWRLIEVVERAQ